MKNNQKRREERKKKKQETNKEKREGNEKVPSEPLFPLANGGIYSDLSLDHALRPDPAFRQSQSPPVWDCSSAERWVPGASWMAM